MKRLQLVAAVAAALAPLAAPAAAQTPPGGDERAAPEREQRAIDLVDRANRRVGAAHPSCRFRPARGRPHLVEGGAGPEVASVLGVFRRPPTEEERALAVQRAGGGPGFGPFFGGAGVPRDGVRVVRAPSGRAVVLTALRDVPPLRPDRATFDRCQALVTAEVERLARSAPPAIARRAKRFQRDVVRNQRPPAVQGPTEGLLTSDLEPGGRALGGGGLAPFVAAQFALRGTGSSSLRRGIGARLTLIVPDGVARIDATFPRVRSAGRFRAPRRYRSTIRRTLTVRDNVAFATVPRSPEDAFPRMVWRAPDGSVVRRVTAP